MLKLPNARWVNLGGFAIVAGMLAFAYYLQYFQGLEPCPLCMFQRIAFFGLGFVFLVAGIHNPNRVGRIVYSVLILIVAGIGVGIAGRHLWLQHLPPDQVPACGPGLDYLMDVFPLLETIEIVLRGSGDCANVSWTFLGLSIPGWALLWFVVLGVAGLVGNLRKSA